MRNDQIAVMLRDFANRCLQWAAVLEKETETPFPDVPVRAPYPTEAIPSTTPSTSLTSDPNPIPLPVATSNNVPPTTTATGTFLNAAVEMKAYERGWQDARNDERRTESRRDAASLPTTFTCPSCNVVRRWHYPGGRPPWPNAVCATCYAEHADRKEAHR